MKKYTILKQFRDSESTDPVGVTNTIWVKKLSPDDPIFEYDTLKEVAKKEKKLKKEYPNKKFKTKKNK